MRRADGGQGEGLDGDGHRPVGCGFGLWQPTGHRGFEVLGEAGAPVWHQLTTCEFAKAVDFYRAVFGWETRVESDTDEFRYTTAVFDGNDVLGVMDGEAILPDGIPSHWTTFFGADDVDKTLQVITDHGGSVLRPAEDTPYGRLAAAADRRRRGVQPVFAAADPELALAQQVASSSRYGPTR